MFGWRCARRCGGRGKPCEPHPAAVTILEAVPAVPLISPPEIAGQPGLSRSAVQSVGAQLVLRRISDTPAITDR
jgi:hypothetical protein